MVNIERVLTIRPRHCALQATEESCPPSDLCPSNLRKSPTDPESIDAFTEKINKCI